MPNRRCFVGLSSAAAFSGLFVPSSGRADLVSHNARIMLGFPAGSSPDFVSRLLAEYVKDYAPSIIVDNRPGAGGHLPLEALKSGERDGSLMVLTPGDQVALFPRDVGLRHVTSRHAAATARTASAGRLRTVRTAIAATRHAAPAKTKAGK